MPSFIDLYAAYSNEQLVHILKYPKDYQEEAVMAAKSVLKDRNLSASYIDNILDELEVDAVVKAASAKIPLLKAEKIMYLIIPVLGLIIWSLAIIYYHEKGYKRKKWESAIYMILGYIIWVGGAIFIRSLRA